VILLLALLVIIAITAALILVRYHAHTTRSTHRTFRPSVGSIGKLFNHSSSPNNEHTVWWKDGQEDERGRWVNGAVELRNAANNRSVFVVRLKRPNSAYVSNDGYVWVEDWKNDGLNGAVIAFSPSGKEKWSKSFRANIRDTKMSPDHQWLVTDTCSSSYEPHSNYRFVINADSGELICKIEFEDTVVLSESGASLEVPIPNDGIMAVSLDKSAESIAQVKKVIRKANQCRKAGDPRRAFNIISKHISAGDVLKAQKALNAFVNYCEDDEIITKPKVLRYRGEIFEAQGKLDEALKHYKQAIALNPKVGVKGRIDRLERKTRKHASSS